MIPSKWALTEESDILVCVCVCVCINVREEGAGFPFPSKEKSSWGAVPLLNKSQIRSPCKRVEGREKNHKSWAAPWSEPSLPQSSNLFFSSPSQLPEPGMRGRWQPPTLSLYSLSLSLLLAAPLLSPSLHTSLPFPAFFWDWFLSVKALIFDWVGQIMCTLTF